MEWFFLLFAYTPIISIAVGLIMLITGFVLKKSKRSLSTGLFIVGGVCIGIWLVVYSVLFFIGALGIGPIPN